MTAASAPGGRPRDPAIDVAVLEATRRSLVERGYAQTSIADVALVAGVSRPAIYRRWPDKLALVADALSYGLERQREALARRRPAPPSAWGRFREAVRRVDPAVVNPDAIALQGGILGESSRTPELLELLRRLAVEPRLAVLEETLVELQRERAVRRDVDVRGVTTLCFGAFFGAALRGESGHAQVADRVAAQVWELVATPSGRRSVELAA